MYKTSGGRDIHLGIALPNYGPDLSVAHLEAVLAAVEESAFDSGWVTDHVAVNDDNAASYGTISEALVTLGYCAALTKRITLGVSALVIPQREPLLLLKQLVSLDFLMGGRLIVAIAAGWLRNEFDALGARFDDRGKRLDAWLDFAEGAVSHMPGRVDVAGSAGETAVWLSPGPSHGGLRLWSAGGSRAALRRAVRVGAWHPVGASIDAVESGVARLREADPDRHVDVVNRLSVTVAPQVRHDNRDERGHLEIRGPAGYIAEELAKYVRAGCDGFLLMLGGRARDSVDRISAFDSDVVPLLAEHVAVV